MVFIDESSNVLVTLLQLVKERACSYFIYIIKHLILLLKVKILLLLRIKTEFRSSIVVHMKYTG